MNNTEENKTFLPSFVGSRSRKKSPRQVKLYEKLLPQITYNKERLDQLKNKYKSITLEIGSGTGCLIAGLAEKNPTTLYIACEVYKDGVMTLLSKIDELNLTNILIYQDDGRNILLEQSSSQTRLFNQIFLTFPDPWPKAKHHKRRIFTQEFLKLVSQNLRPDDSNDDQTIFLAVTDEPSYKVWIQEELEKQDLLKVTSNDEPAWWVKSKFYKKAIADGRTPKFFICQMNHN